MLTSTCVDWPWNDAACAGLLGMLAPLQHSKPEQSITTCHAQFQALHHAP